MLSYMVAYVVALLVEWPTMGMIKLLFPKAKSKASEARNVVQTESVDAKLQQNQPAESLSANTNESNGINHPSDQPIQSNQQYNQAYEKELLKHDNTAL